LLGSLFGTAAYDKANKVNQTVYFKSGLKYDFYVPQSLRYVEILSGSIYGYALQNISWIEELVIGEDVTYLGKSLTKGCTAIQIIRYNAKNIESVEEGVFVDVAKGNSEYYLTLYIGDNVEVIPDNLFKGIGKLTTINFAKSGKLTKIGNSAFYGCSMQTVSISSGVVSIGEEAFSHCQSMTSLYLPNTLERIGDKAFYYCTRLANPSYISFSKVIIPESVTYIGNQAFWSIGATNVTFADTQSQWLVTYFSDATRTQTVAVNDITTNATNLKSTYTLYIWTKIV
jgi:hypothetical protein